MEKKKAVLKFICIQFSPLGMLIPNLRASISMKLIYPANSHVEQQIAFLPKWIECIQPNHHPAKGVQINLSWLLFFIAHFPPVSCPQKYPFHFDPLLFLTLKWNVGICPENYGNIFMFLFFCTHPNWCWETLQTSLRKLCHIHCGMFDRNSGESDIFQRQFSLISPYSYNFPAGTKNFPELLE